MKIRAQLIQNDHNHLYARHELSVEYCCNFPMDVKFKSYGKNHFRIVKTCSICGHRDLYKISLFYGLQIEKPYSYNVYR